MTDSASDSILSSRDGHVAWVTFNRPEKRNALDPAARELLESTLSELDSDPEVRVVVLTGAGSAFCAGTDLSAGTVPGTTKPLVAPVEQFSKPIIAAVNGPAAGGGFEFALACDLRVASTTAKFLLPEVRIGSLPGSGGTQRIFSALPSAIAWKTLLTGDPLGAEDALRFGLVSDLFGPEEFTAGVTAIADRIASAAPLSLAAAKQAGRVALEGEAGGFAVERELWEQLSHSSDRAEGRAAFAEKRQPRFEGR
jgi:enoyl-CoA hydratase/carnithine racemase